jgi:HEPN domain-containing protein
VKPEAERWFRRSREDMRAAKYNFKGGFWEAASFHSHQAVEKALKALLLERTGDYPHIHDLAELATRIDAPAKVVEACTLISPAYLAARYPDVPPLEKEETDAHVQSAEEVVGWVRSQLV